jgi:putative transcriptional regulator
MACISRTVSTLIPLAALLLCPVPQAPAQTPRHAALAGQLLIASPTMGDPRFAQTVIVIVRHDSNGAFGIVVNRPLGERPLAQLLEAMGEKNAGAAGTVRIFAGGPVQPELGFVLHSAEFRLPETTDIDGRIAMTSSREILRAIASRLGPSPDPSKGPSHSLIAFGYAGWGPGQLEGELAQRAWFTAPAEAKLIFEEERAKVWDIAVSRRTQDL